MNAGAAFGLLPANFTIDHVVKEMKTNKCCKKEKNAKAVVGSSNSSCDCWSRYYMPPKVIEDCAPGAAKSQHEKALAAGAGAVLRSKPTGFQ